MSRRRPRIALALVAAGLLAGALTTAATPAAAAPERTATPARTATPERAAAPGQAAPAAVQGRGSSYVAPAMTQWTAAVFPRGLRVGYLPTNSPDGLGQYQQSTIDFAGTEAEFTSLLGLGNDSQVNRGFQYVPDVAGAVAIMYNVDDRAGNPVRYLRLRRETVARIFLGEITRWSDQAITDDLGGQIRLPDEEITVVFRAGPSGTTALFYDFVAHMAPGLFRSWVERNRFPSGVRIIDPGVSPDFVPRGLGLQGSDQMAQHVARTKWTITYDEFAYARRYDVPTAWVQNASGNFVQPYAANISAALESAELRDDLSQELAGVYNSPEPDAYPISAYSYLVTQCAPDPERPTCRQGYADAGKAATLSAWMRFVACEGQVQMAEIGYSPLPPVLSQEMANSVARLNDAAPEQLNAQNCANPRFDPGYRPPAQPEPPPLPAPTGDGTPGPSGAEGAPGAAPGATPDGPAAGAGPEGADATTTTAGDAAAADESALAAGAGREGGNTAVGGGSGTWRDDDPVSYRGPGIGPLPLLPVAVLALLIAFPLLAGPVARRVAAHRRG